MEITRAPRLNAQNLPWFNVKTPLDLPDLKDKLVILDFWTYCCINCMHIIPTLKQVEARFPDSLVVIGVHSPKFSGEKVTENLERAIERYEIQHPIVHDKDFTIWKNFAVRAWPTLVFIGPDGYILGQIPGEPDPEMLADSIGKVIDDMKGKRLLQGNAADLLCLSPTEAHTTLRFPGKIAYNPSAGEFAIADSNHNQVVTAGREGTLTRRIGSGKAGRRDGSLEEAEFFRPQGLCYHEGIIWVADTENHLIRKIDLAAGKVSTVAGTGRQGGVLKERAPGSEVALSSVWDVSLAGNHLYFANAGTHQIGLYEVEEKMAGPFAGTGQEALIDGPRHHGAFAQPSGLSIGENRLFLADSETSSIRSVELTGAGFIDTYTGTGLFDFGDRDGKGTEALLQHPLGVHYFQEKVFIADSYNHKIKVLDLKSHEVTTLAPSTRILCGDSTCNRLWEPAGAIAVGHCLYVSDTNNHRIVEINLETETAKIFIG
ncbi:MAG: thioredoxin-like domain-containing protein [Nitrospinaceae bacterium]